MEWIIPNIPLESRKDKEERSFAEIWCWYDNYLSWYDETNKAAVLGPTTTF